ncbi:DNA alkylation repair protein [Candidatus Woesearchaeota archaeon]|nr:DNA alkylation repair protein [Candidatus Woesearchaeota archaeon]
MLIKLKQTLQRHADSERAKILQRFFKTGKGEYGEGDIFLGITVPVQRQIAKTFHNLTIKDIHELLKSKIHEHRLLALLILVGQYEKGSSTEKKEIVVFYLKHGQWINNWDLVDLSAPKILGDYLLDNPRDVLYKLVRSPSVWERRIAIIATYTFIRHQQFDDTIHIAELLMKDSHDLIHKAVGWMLREVGKQSLDVEEQFVNEHCQHMPRTMLRYAIERFPEQKRKIYLQKR